jgi:hypothetical protein
MFLTGCSADFRGPFVRFAATPPSHITSLMGGYEPEFLHSVYPVKRPAIAGGRKVNVKEVVDFAA